MGSCEVRRREEHPPARGDQGGLSGRGDMAVRGDGVGTKGTKGRPRKTATSLSNQKEWGSGIGWQAKEFLRDNRKPKKGEEWKAKKIEGTGSSELGVEVREAQRWKQPWDSSSWVQRSTLRLQNDPFPEGFG